MAKTDMTTQKQSRELAGFDSSETAGLVGMGYSEKSEDSLVPIVAVLQDNSGEVKKGHSKKMEGAESGDIIIRSSKRLIKATAANPLITQFCAYDHMWQKWRGEPGEGVVTGQFAFDERPVEAREVPDSQNPDRVNIIMPDGDRLVDTRFWYCNIFDDEMWRPVVIPMGGTNHTVSRMLTNQLKAIRIPGGGPAPSWFRQWGLSTKFNQRGSQSWYNYSVDDAGWIQDKEVRDMGRAMFEAAQSQMIRPDVAVAEGDSVDDDAV